MTETLLSDRAWLWIAAALYSGGFVFGTISLARNQRHPRGLMFFIIISGFVVQTFGLYLRGKAVGGCPIGNTFEILQFTTWSATALYLAVGAAFRLSLLGYFTTVLAATLSVVSLAISPWDSMRRVGIFGGNPWIEFHAALALFSYGVFGLLALTSIMYLLQWFSLKRQRMNGIYSFLPPIRDLDHINVRLLSVGTALLAASLVVGSIHWFKNTGAAVNTAMLILGALWLAYAIALALRLTNIFPTRRLAWTCIALFAAAIVTLGFINAHRMPPPSLPSHAASMTMPRP